MKYTKPSYEREVIASEDIIDCLTVNISCIELNIEGELFYFKDRNECDTFIEKMKVISPKQPYTIEEQQHCHRRKEQSYRYCPHVNIIHHRGGNQILVIHHLLKRGDRDISFCISIQYRYNYCHKRKDSLKSQICEKQHQNISGLLENVFHYINH